MGTRISPARGAAVGAAALLAVATFVPATASAAGSQNGSGFNQPGNVVIADQFNNRVVEVDRQHHVVWHFGDGSSVAGPKSIVGTNDAERVGDLTLIAGTGTPAGADPSCSDPNGCVDNRVILVNEDGRIVWQYGSAGVTGAGSCSARATSRSTAPASASSMPPTTPRSSATSPGSHRRLQKASPPFRAPARCRWFPCSC